MFLADDTTTLIDIVSKGGVIGLLTLIVIGFYKEWIVTGPSHRRDIAKCEREADEWKQLALAGTELAERHLDVVARIAAKGR